MRPIRVAVLGAGYWGTKVSREYAAIQRSNWDVRLACVVDSSTAALDSLKKEIGGGEGRSFRTDYNSVLKDEEVDAVHIALPTSFHYTVARAALEAGKHVLLEKPMASSSREAFKLASLAEENGLVLQVGHIFRFNSALRMVRRMLNEGVVGRVFYAKLEWTVDQIPSGDRDIVFDLAPHPVDVLNYLLDEWPSSVDAVGDSYVREKELLEEMAFINLLFPDRVLANVYLSWIQHGGKDRIVRIVGEKGTLFCDALNQTVTFYTPDGPLEVPRSSFPTLSAAGWKGLTSHSMGDKTVPNNTIRDMQFQFLDAIEGRVPQLNSSLIGTRNLQVLEAITTSMRARRAGHMQLQPPPVVLQYADGR